MKQSKQKMKRYSVLLSEVWKQRVFVEAEGPEDARAKALEGNDVDHDNNSFVYSHTLDEIPNHDIQEA